jgi:chemotaxis protein methyltransferase WspC
VLSVPCSTGEEPYSIAITLKDAGLPLNQFHIDAIDLSRRALQKAARGVYGLESFRDKGNLAFREQYFVQIENSFHISTSLKNTVCFMQGNLINKQLFAVEDAYDVIFCRNLLIYLGESAKVQAVKRLNALLAKNGILFVGHAERPAFNEFDFRWIRQSGVFACQRSHNIHNTSQRSASKIKPHPESGEKLIEGKQKHTAILKKKHGRPSPLQKKKRSFETPPEPVEGNRQARSHLLQRRGKPLLPPQFERRKTEHLTAEPSLESGEQPIPFVDRRKPRDEATTLLDTARQLADQGALEDALELCEKVLHQDAVHVQAHFLKGLIHQALGDEAQAEQWLNRTVYLDPNHHEALHYLAFLAEFQGDHKKSLLLRQRMERIQKKRVED